jgi:hypothetical protein
MSDKSENNEPKKDPHVIKVTAKGDARSSIKYALTQLESSDFLEINATGSAIVRALTLVENLKRDYEGDLHQ